MDAYGREINGESPSQVDASLRRFDQLGDIGVARVEAGIGVYDADYGAGERILAVAEGFDEHFPEKEREMGIAICCQTLSEA